MITVESVKTYHLVQGSYRKEFRIPKEGDVAIITYCRGERYHTGVCTLEEARKLWRMLQNKGWSEF